MRPTYLVGLGPVAAVIRAIGVRHEGAPQLVIDGLHLDLGRALHNQAHNPTLRYLTGLDGDVYEHVPTTPASWRFGLMGCRRARTAQAPATGAGTAHPSGVP
ncbi:hypothetical protein ACLMNJ_34050 [Streptomyces seoulensis]